MGTVSIQYTTKHLIIVCVTLVLLSGTFATCTVVREGSRDQIAIECIKAGAQWTVRQTRECIR